MSRTTQPALLVVAGTNQLARGYCIEQVADRYPVVLIDDKPPTWQQHLVIDHETADTRDPAAVTTAGLALAQRHPIAGVLTWDEYALTPTAELAARLGLPGNTVTATNAARNKAESRRLFAEHGVPSALSIRVDTLPEAAAAARRTGFPLVLKPVSNAGSIGVIRVDTPHELPAAWQFTSAGAQGQGPEGRGVLVEEYLAGPEISVECTTVNAITTVLAVTHKQLGFAPYFEETGHTVTAGDPLLPQVTPIAQAAVRALGLTDGIQHVEMRLTDRGPRIIEVNGRIGGDMIGVLVRLATGLDLPQTAADIATGTRPHLTPTTSRTAAIAIFYPPATGHITAREMRLEPGPANPWLYQVDWEREIGEHVALPPHGDVDSARVGFAIVTADHPHTAHDHITHLTDHLTLTITP